MSRLNHMTREELLREVTKFPLSPNRITATRRLMNNHPTVSELFDIMGYCEELRCDARNAIQTMLKSG